MRFRSLMGGLVLAAGFSVASAGSLTLSDSSYRTINFEPSIHRVTVRAFSTDADVQALESNLQALRTELLDRLNSSGPGTYDLSWSGDPSKRLALMRIPAVEPSPVLPVHILSRVLEVDSKSLARDEFVDILVRTNTEHVDQQMISLWGIDYTLESLPVTKNYFAPFVPESGRLFRSSSELSPTHRDIYLKNQSDLVSDLSSSLEGKCRKSLGEIDTSASCIIKDADIVIEDTLSIEEGKGRLTNRITVSVTATWPDQ